METLIYDIAGGFIRFDQITHTFKTISGLELGFTQQELDLIRDVFTQRKEYTIRDIPFLSDTQILTYLESKNNQYTAKTLRDRINYYQQ